MTASNATAKGDLNGRWRQAKTLYRKGHYGEALTVLRHLRKRKFRKLNLYRYLAATYYRVGKYEKATEALGQGLDIWPEDISLREQLATTLEAQGNIHGAYNCWKEILRREPQHAQAAKRMRAITEGAGTFDPGDSSNGIATPSSEAICPECGARNAAEFDRCWQCHAELRRRAAAPPETVEVSEPLAESKPRSQAGSEAGGRVVPSAWLLGLDGWERASSMAAPPTWP